MASPTLAFLQSLLLSSLLLSCSADSLPRPLLSSLTQHRSLFSVLHLGATEHGTPPAPLSPPGGSWVSRCTLESWAGGLLKASCEDGRETELNHGVLCAPFSPVATFFGRLVCDVSSSSLPGGTWKSSCAAESWSAGILRARCHDKVSLSDLMPVTELNYNTLCAPGSRVNNAGGSLACATPREVAASA